MSLSPQKQRSHSSSKGEFIRSSSFFRDWVSSSGGSDFPAFKSRYHLYISHACPWAHRTALVRVLKGLEDAISLSSVDPVRDERGWAFGPPGSDTVDPVNGYEFLSEVYQATDENYAGRITVPVLWDRQTGRIVNNESSEIIQMLNGEFNEWGDRSVDLYPKSQRSEIDSINKIVYTNINDAVYRCGFAREQGAYERAFDDLFGALDWIEDRLEGTRYLVGNKMTLADWRLFPTLLRFDLVYADLFKCNKRRIKDYRNLSSYLRDLYSVPGVKETVRLDEIKRHYYLSLTNLNPMGILPRGPEIELGFPHGRGIFPEE